MFISNECLSWFSYKAVNGDRVFDTRRSRAHRNLKITPAPHPQNQVRKKHVSFASRQCKATLQCTNSGRHDKPEIHSRSTPSLQPRFGTVRLLVVPVIDGDIKRSTFFIGCRSWGSCAQMDQQPTRNFLRGWNERTDRMIEKMCSRKWWQCWKINVQYVREINFFHSDITAIILYCQKLISYNWRTYLSVTPCMCVEQLVWRFMGRCLWYVVPVSSLLNMKLLMLDEWCKSSYTMESHTYVLR